MIILQEGSHIIATMLPGHFRIRKDTLISTAYGKLRVIKFLAELVIQIIGISMIRSLRSFFLHRFHGIYQPSPYVILIG